MGIGKAVSLIALVVALVVGLPTVVRAQAEGSENTFDTLSFQHRFGARLPLITDEADLDSFLNRLVVIRGELGNTKIPRIVNVIVRDGGLRNQEAYAVGILVRWERDPEIEYDDDLPDDGASVKYLLYFDLVGRLAEAQAVPNCEFEQARLDQEQ